MHERIVYPGSFRPFHSEHFNRLLKVKKLFPEGEITIAISDCCDRSFISIEKALKIARLSVPDGVSVLSVSPNPLVTAKKLQDEKITHVMTGSKKTIFLLSLLKRVGYWNGEIITLDNSGIHATQIRKWIKDGDDRWKKYIAQPAVSFLEAEM